MSKIFYIMRHGQTLFNVRKKIQGACDSPLTELGIKQAEAASKYFKDIELTHAYSSTSERCCDTLEIVTNGKMPYIRLKGLKEMNFGTYEGESEDLNPPSHLKETYFKNFGGESRDDVKDRLKETCIEIMEKENHDSVLAVSHAGACLHFLRNWMTDEEINQLREKGLKFSNCCIFKYQYEDKQFKLIDVINPN